MQLHHMLHKHIPQQSLHLCRLNLPAVNISVLLVNLLLQYLYLVDLLLNHYILIIVVIGIVLVTLLLLLLLLIIQQIYIKSVQLLILLLYQLRSLLLNQTQVRTLDRGYPHVNQIAQYEVVKVNSPHSRKVGQDAHRQLHRDGRQHILIQRIKHLLQYHLSYLHHHYYHPNVGIKKSRVCEVQITRRT